MTREKAFEQWLAALPASVQTNIRYVMERKESYTQKAFSAGWEARGANEPQYVTVPQLPTGPLTPELIAEAKRICEEAGLVLNEPYVPCKHMSPIKPGVVYELPCKLCLAEGES